MTTTHTATLQAPDRDTAARIENALEALTAPPVAITARILETGQWEVVAYFPRPPDPDTLQPIAAAAGQASFVIVDLPDVDWVTESQKMLPPVTVGRFWIHGSAAEQDAPAGRQALCVDASEAFGTGHHASTQGCLLAIDHLAAAGVQPTTVSDLGCGTAILAMASARCWPAATIIATDHDENAIAITAATLATNGLAERIALAVANALDHPLHRRTQPHDLILANLLLADILDLAGDTSEGCSRGGRLVLAGLLANQSDPVREAYQRCGFVEEKAFVLGEWSTLLMRRS